MKITYKSLIEKQSLIQFCLLAKANLLFYNYKQLLIFKINLDSLTNFIFQGQIAFKTWVSNPS